MSSNIADVRPYNLKLKIGTWFHNTCARGSNECVYFTWESSNEAVASVNPTSGYIYAQSLGNAVITAHGSDGSSGSIAVTVLEHVPVERIELYPRSFTIEPVTTYDITTRIYPITAEDKTLEWTSSDEDIARVVDGTVYGMTPGTATITARATNGISDSCTVKVTGDIIVSSVTLDRSSAQVFVGKTTMLHATVLPENATHRSVGWSSTNPEVATVNPCSGLVMGHKAGVATICATAKDIGHAEGSCIVEVKNVPVSGISLSQSELEINVGEDGNINASVLPRCTPKAPRKPNCAAN